MTYVKDLATVSIEVERYLDADGKPTCIGDVRTNDVCPFLMVSHFGTKEHCFWEVTAHDEVDPPVLERRSNGTGRLIPHSACPIWNSRWIQENN